MQKYAKSKEAAGEAYFYLFHDNFAQTAKLIFELLTADSELVQMFGRNVDYVIWLAEKIRPEGDRPSDIEKVLQQIFSSLRTKQEYSQNVDGIA